MKSKRRNKKGFANWGGGNFVHKKAIEQFGFSFVNIQLLIRNRDYQFSATCINACFENPTYEGNNLFFTKRYDTELLPIGESWK